MKQLSKNNNRVYFSPPWIPLIPLFFIIILSACSSSITPQIDRKSSYALKDVTQTSLARAYQRKIKQHKGKSGFVLLGSGLDAFAARTALFKRAEKSIDVQYYQVRDDVTGYLFYQALRQAANRGVRVRILLDDYELQGQTAKLAAIDRYPNIEVRIFNPFSRHSPRLLQYIFQVGKITRRMHNKSVTIDNKFMIIGSRNIGNEYSEAQSKRVFSGMEVLAVGPITQKVSASFDTYWNFKKTIKVSNLAKPIPPQTDRFKHSPMMKHFFKALRTSPLVKQIQHNTLKFQWAHAVLIKDSPNKILQKPNRHEKKLNVKAFESFVKQAENEIFIITPYFIPGHRGLRYFQRLRDKGVNISVLTNSYQSTDMKIVNAHYNSYRKDLLRMGVKLYEFKSTNRSINLLQRAQKLFNRPVKAGLHAKVISFDRNKLYVGSMNIDPRSLYENTEIGVIINSSKITGRITQWLDKNLNELAYHLELRNNHIIWHDRKNNKILTSEPDTIISQRFWMNLMRILPVESQL
ncbi:MAG: hypothetical protein DSZ29_01470 [Aquificaceae bacterium]|nr:MAG: hypothetical protein DSZ29_01470 [Aquificaceae bacterium]